MNLFIHPLGLLATSLISAVIAMGCGGGPSERERIPEVREARGNAAEAPDMTTAERLGFVRQQQQQQQQQQLPEDHPPLDTPADAPVAEEGPPLTWDTPSGWVVQPSTPFRTANFTVEESRETECYLTVLPGDAGGLLANLNRWRQQIGAEPLSEAAVADLPQRPMLGTQGVFMTAEGDYAGMGGQGARTDYMLAGLAAQTGGQSYFVKMTGPAAVVKEEIDNFLAFCESLRFDDAPAGEAPENGPEESPAMPDAPDTAGERGGAIDPPQLTWTAPEAWDEGPEKPMRLVTFLAGPDNEAECRVFMLPERAGGVEANVNRWRQQMGQPPLSAGEIDGLPTKPCLGREAIFMTAEGTYTGMDGNTKAGQKMLGLICPLDNFSVFVLMTGPSAVIKAERENFLAFCASLR